jgi:hypothetical protein
MSNIWEELDNATDLDGLKKDVEDAADGGGDFKEVPHGEYEVSVEKLEMKKTKKGDPMLSAWLNILDGEFKGSKLFYNQVLSTSFGIHFASEFLRSLEVGDIKFEGYAKFAATIETCKAEIDAQKLEYKVEYGENKGYSTFEIKEVFEVE